MFHGFKKGRSWATEDQNNSNHNAAANADDVQPVTPPHASSEKAAAQQQPHHHHHLPFHHRHPKTKGIKQEGESGRSGIHPLKFLRICFRSSCTLSMMVNILWPLVPAAIAVHFVFANSDEHNVLVFVLNYLAMIPSANLIGFAGQELARKLPKVFGVLLETTLGSTTEIILFIVLVSFASREEPLVRSGFAVVKAAILGSILANLLLALGLCFIAGGIRHSEQVFHAVISEVGNGLLLVAGFALIVPAAFATVYTGQITEIGTVTDANEENRLLKISRITAILLFIAFATFVFFQMSSHHSIYDDVLEEDERKDRDGHKDLSKEKLTLTECVVALLIGITCVALTAVFMVLEIDGIIDQKAGRITEAFMGLILVPLVEKVAEHLTAVDEAWDNQANFALVHVLGSCIQTALLNTPIAMFVSWGIDVHTNGLSQLDLNFRPFEAIMLILSIIVVGNFLRDGKSNYLEGVLCVLVYIIIAVCAFYYEPTVPEGAQPIEKLRLLRT